MQKAGPTFQIYRGLNAPEKVYRFRYEICENEMHQQDDYADHARCIIRDPLDETGYLVVANVGERIVGTARVNFCAEGDPGYYLDFYELESAGAGYPETVSFSTRIMVDKEYRGGLLPLQISVECFRLGLEKKVRWCFCGCGLDLVPFFQKLGYEVINPCKIHRNYGATAVMRFDLHDPKHYDRKRSMFARYLGAEPPVKIEK